MNTKIWQTAARQIRLDRTLVMAILNATPDSFSDGGRFLALDDALRQTEQYLNEGADILDVGGESTRPHAADISIEEERRRVIPLIAAIKKRFDIPISIDTTKSEVAESALEAGAEIINDISGLTFDEKIAETAAQQKAGLVLMHLRGSFQTMHAQRPVDNILQEIFRGFRASLQSARAAGVADEQLVFDVGLGFSKSFEQNLELIGKLDKIIAEFPEYPMLIGASRKSFIGKTLGDLPVDQRLSGSLSVAAIAAWNGADIIRVHDVKETVEALKIVNAIKKAL